MKLSKKKRIELLEAQVERLIARVALLEEQLNDIALVFFSSNPDEPKN